MIFQFPAGTRTHMLSIESNDIAERINMGLGFLDESCSSHE